MKKCNENINKALELADRLLELGAKGDEEREDEGCGVLYGIIRDAGYRVRELAEKEKEKHIKNGKWDETEVSVG